MDAESCGQPCGRGGANGKHSADILANASGPPRQAGSAEDMFKGNVEFTYSRMLNGFAQAQGN